MSPWVQPPDCSATTKSPKDVGEDAALILSVNCKTALRWGAAVIAAWGQNESGLGELPVFKIILNIQIFYAAFWNVSAAPIWNSILLPVNQ